MSTTVLTSTRLASEGRPVSIRSLFDSVPLLALSLVLGALGLTVVGVLENSLLATWTVAIGLGVVGTGLLLTAGRTGRSHDLLVRQFWVTFGLRIFVAFILHLWLRNVYGEMPYWGWGTEGGDERWFFETAGRFSAAWQDGSIFQREVLWEESITIVWLQILGFIRFVGTVFGGDTIFNAKLASCLAGALIVPYIYKVALRVFDARIAGLAAALAFWLPDYWIYSSALLRDVLVSFVVVLFFYQVIEIAYGNLNVRRLLLAGVSLVMIRYLRVELLIAILPIATLAWLTSRRERRQVKGLTVRKLIVGIGVIIFALYGVATISFYGWENIVRKITVEAPLVVEEAGMDSLGARLLQLPNFLRVPLSIAHLFLTPAPPWGDIQNSGFTPLAVVGTIAGLVWWALLPFLVVGFVQCIRHYPRRTVWIWGTALAIAILLGASTGVMPRWRLMMMPFLLIVIAQGRVVRSRYSLLVALTVLVLLGVLLVYSVMKQL